jgi:hypothetical protein
MEIQSYWRLEGLCLVHPRILVDPPAPHQILASGVFAPAISDKNGMLSDLTFSVSALKLGSQVNPTENSTLFRTILQNKEERSTAKLHIFWPFLERYLIDSRALETLSRSRVCYDLVAG